MNVNALQHKVTGSDIPPERLARNSSLTEQQKIAEASRQFEAILLRQILENTQKTVIKSKLSDDSTASSVYRDMVTSQLADSMSKSGGIGLAKTFEQQLGGRKGPASVAGHPSPTAIHNLPAADHAAADSQSPHGRPKSLQGASLDSRHLLPGARPILSHP